MYDFMSRLFCRRKLLSFAVCAIDGSLASFCMSCHILVVNDAVVIDSE
jgi:hypothetical protein